MREWLELAERILACACFAVMLAILSALALWLFVVSIR